MNNINNVSLIEENNCTGCSACMNICPKEAITMEEDVLGNFFPSVNSNCVNCGLCLKRCQVNKHINLRKSIKCYASWVNDSNEHIKSSSGGICALLSKAIIENGGVVYGCVSDKTGIHHTRISKSEDLDLLRGSKYVQSKIDFIYRDVICDLKNNFEVLFIGTPCEIAGLLSILDKDYENLYVIDLICHEAPPQKILYECLELNGVKRTLIDRISFRDNYNFVITVYNENKIIYKKDDLHDKFYYIFEDAVCCRNSCVQCKYATPNRLGDITLGDFHNIQNKKDFNYETDGAVSLSLINSNKGFQLIDLIKDGATFIERNISEAYECNPQLLHSTSRKASYDKFVDLYKKKGLNYAINHCLFKRKIKNLLLSLKQRLHK